MTRGWYESMEKRDGGRNKYGTDGMRMSREEECVSLEYIGVLHVGKIFRFLMKE
jgi:hypothetical protein